MQIFKFGDVVASSPSFSRPSARAPLRTCSKAIDLLLFPSKIFPFPEKLASHNSMGMKDDKVGNKTRLDKKERKRKESEQLKEKKLADRPALYPKVEVAFNTRITKY